jgi:multiple sugar transport system substrate-binding protein
VPGRETGFTTANRFGYGSSDEPIRSWTANGEVSRMGRLWPVVIALATGLSAMIVVGCGGSDDQGGPVNLKLYGPADPNGTNLEAMRECSAESNGRYTIEQVPLANNADASRELLVRRLAAEDGDIDLINMDVIWTPEFAEAGWLRKLEGEEKAQATDDVLEGPLKTVTWEGDVYAVPLNTNAQLLWYRKDLVPRAPETWDEMIAMAKEIPAPQGIIQEQGARYEGYTVWFNSLVSSAGGSIVDADGEPTLGEPAVRAAEVIRAVATSGRADPSLSTNQEDQGRLAFEDGRGAFMLNWPYVYAAGRTDAETSETAAMVFENLGWSRWPSVEPGEPSRVSIGGANLGISNFGRDPELATEAAICMTSRKWQDLEAINEGLPPVVNSSYDDPEVRKSYPFADLLREQLQDAVPRPETPSYSDVTLAIQQTLHPPAAIDPESAIDTLRDRLNTLADGGLY